MTRPSSTTSPFQRPQGPPRTLPRVPPKTAPEESGMRLPQREMYMGSPPGDGGMDGKAFAGLNWSGPQYGVWSGSLICCILKFNLCLRPSLSQYLSMPSPPTSLSVFGIWWESFVSLKGVGLSMSPCLSPPSEILYFSLLASDSVSLELSWAYLLPPVGPPWSSAPM